MHQALNVQPALTFCLDGPAHAAVSLYWASHDSLVEHDYYGLYRAEPGPPNLAARLRCWIRITSRTPTLLDTCNELHVYVAGYVHYELHACVAGYAHDELHACVAGYAQRRAARLRCWIRAWRATRLRSFCRADL